MNLKLLAVTGTCCFVALASITTACTDDESSSSSSSGGSSGASSGGSSGASSGGSSSGGSSSGGSSSGGSSSGGSSSGGSSGTPQDAGQDADSGGNTPSADCTAYCNCMPTKCPGSTVPGSGADCLAKCATFTTQQQSCRKNHCNLAQGTDDTTHCPHAIGQNGQCQ